MTHAPKKLKNKVIITGGWSGGNYLNARKVVAYNLNGWLEDLLNMNDLRFGHGCGQLYKY